MHLHRARQKSYLSMNNSPPVHTLLEKRLVNAVGRVMCANLTLLLWSGGLWRSGTFFFLWFIRFVRLECVCGAPPRTIRGPGCVTVTPQTGDNEVHPPRYIDFDTKFVMYKVIRFFPLFYHPSSSFTRFEPTNALQMLNFQSLVAPAMIGVSICTI